MSRDATKLPTDHLDELLEGRSLGRAWSKCWWASSWSCCTPLWPYDDTLRVSVS